MLKNIYIAFLFLTRIPMPKIDSISAEDNGRALLFFPWVGLAIGLLLWGFASAFGLLLPANVVAALIIAVWAAITGGLHLDGLADSADAWLAGGNTERSLDIMKDPRCGAAAVISVVCLLLLKFSALSELLSTGCYWPLIFIPMLARCGSQLLLLCTPYARPEGLGRDFNDHAPKSLIKIQLVVLACITAIFIMLAFSLYSVVIIAIIAALIFYSLRRLMIQRLGGATGDTAGALVEVLEAGILIAFLF